MLFLLPHFRFGTDVRTFGIEDAADPAAGPDLNFAAHDGFGRYVFQVDHIAFDASGDPKLIRLSSPEEEGQKRSSGESERGCIIELFSIDWFTGSKGGV